ncbi:VOC family protein [Sphingomonas sanguinis]|uniref:VOC family protein n=1 Tax=Sphingomonas sanguinis TaxID=33051 RepID=UPI00301966FC
MRLNQVTLGATDFEASVRFYTALGLRLIVSARDEYARFELPEGEATLSLNLQSHVPRRGEPPVSALADRRALSGGSR